MKLLSTFIKELEALKDAHGDLPVITYNWKSDFFSGKIDNDASVATFGKDDAWDAKDKVCDCIVIE